MYWTACIPSRSLELLSDTSGHRWSSLADDYEENQYDVSQMKTAERLNVHTSCYRVRHIICGCSEAIINIYIPREPEHEKKEAPWFCLEKASLTLQHSNSSKLFSGNAEAEKSLRLILVVSQNEVKIFHEGKIILNLLYMLTVVETTSGLMYSMV